MYNVRNKVIWITGASSGIGEELAYQLNAKGNFIILSSRRKTELEKVKNQCKFPENTKVHPLDLTNFESLERITDDAWNLYGKIDILINNGGVSQRSLLLETKFEVYKQMIDINYLGTIKLSMHLLPYFVNIKTGHFVTVSSIMGKFSSPYRSGYCGAKHALHGFFDSLRMEHENDGISVTMICPGFVQTNVAKNALVGDGTKLQKQDNATDKGMPVTKCAKEIVKAIEHKKYEIYVGGKEKIGVYIKRFFPKLLHKLVLRSEVR